MKARSCRGPPSCNNPSFTQHTCTAGRAGMCQGPAPLHLELRAGRRDLLAQRQAHLNQGVSGLDFNQGEGVSRPGSNQGEGMSRHELSTMWRMIRRRSRHSVPTALPANCAHSAAPQTPLNPLHSVPADAGRRSEPQWGCCACWPPDRCSAWATWLAPTGRQPSV